MLRFVAKDSATFSMIPIGSGRVDATWNATRRAAGEAVFDGHGVGPTGLMIEARPSAQVSSTADRGRGAVRAGKSSLIPSTCNIESKIFERPGSQTALSFIANNEALGNSSN